MRPPPPLWSCIARTEARAAGSVRRSRSSTTPEVAVTEARSTSAEGEPPGGTAEPDEVAYGARMEGHGGELAVAVARRYGVETMYTLSGAHVFPLYDAAV